MYSFAIAIIAMIDLSREVIIGIGSKYDPFGSIGLSNHSSFGEWAIGEDIDFDNHIGGFGEVL